MAYGVTGSRTRDAVFAALMALGEDSAAQAEAALAPLRELL